MLESNFIYHHDTVMHSVATKEVTESAWLRSMLLLYTSRHCYVCGGEVLLNTYRLSQLGLAAELFAFSISLNYLK